MSKLLSSQNRKYDLADLNPEFTGIAKHLGKSHLVRKQAEQQRLHMNNRVSFMRKEEEQAEKKIMKKQKELQTLMTVIARRQSDVQQKEAQRQARQEALAEQRQINLRRRNQNQQKKRNALLSLYEGHHQNVNKMRSTQQRHEIMRRSYRKDIQQQKKDKHKRLSMDKEEAKKKIQIFHKERIDLYTSRYKNKIQQEEAQAKRIQDETQLCLSQEASLRLKLQNSSSRIEALQDEIKRASLESRGMHIDRSWNWSSLSKVYYEEETKQETSSREPDSRLDKFIEKELIANQP